MFSDRTTYRSGSSVPRRYDFDFSVRQFRKRRLWPDLRKPEEGQNQCTRTILCEQKHGAGGTAVNAQRELKKEIEPRILRESDLRAKLGAHG